ncbi:hypothetical protein [Streptomyces zhihengii]
MSAGTAQPDAEPARHNEKPNPSPPAAHQDPVANGESDRMVPGENTPGLAARLPRGELAPLYPDAGHEGIFHYHDEFVAQALGLPES